MTTKAEGEGRHGELTSARNHGQPSEATTEAPADSPSEPPRRNGCGDLGAPARGENAVLLFEAPGVALCHGSCGRVRHHHEAGRDIISLLRSGHSGAEVGDLPTALGPASSRAEPRLWSGHSGRWALPPVRMTPGDAFLSDGLEPHLLSHQVLVSG